MLAAYLAGGVALVAGTVCASYEQGYQEGWQDACKRIPIASSPTR